MTNELDPRDEAYQYFLQEAAENLQSLELGLLSLREEYSNSKINTLMRAAHSLKGGSSLFGLTDIQTIAHNLENVFKALYSLDCTVDVPLEELLLQAYDCLKTPLLEQLETNHCNTAKFLTRSKEIFTAIETKLGRSLEQEMALPEIDLIFSQDDSEASSTASMILQLLEGELPSFEELLLTSTPVELESQLIGEVQKFAEIGDHFDLPVLASISHIVSSALTEHPESAVELGKLTLENYRAIQKNLLNGNEASADVPSSALLELAHKNAEQQKANQPDVLLTLPETTNPLEVVGQEPTTQTLGIRVDVARFDNLSSLVGELVTQDNGSLLQYQQYKTTAERLEEWLQEFYQLRNNLESISHATMAGDELDFNAIAMESIRQEINSDFQSGVKRLVQTLTDKIHKNILDLIKVELSTSTFKLSEISQDIVGLNKQNKLTLSNREHTLKQLQSNLIQARMMPIKELLNRFPRMVRDLSAKYRKEVVLNLTGSTTLVDRAIIEKLYDPLVHLVRNAFDHGIESPELREWSQKPPQGTIEIRTFHQGNYTYIDIEDDGQGIDLEKVKAKIVKLNLLSQFEVSLLSEAQIYQYLFTPGFSTTETATELSGRGVGLDVVQRQVALLKGSIQISSKQGIGTTFSLRLPYTLSFSQLLVFSANGALFAIATSDLSSIISAKVDRVEYEGTQAFYRSNDRKIPILTNLTLPTHNSTERSLFGNPEQYSTEIAEETTFLAISQKDDMVILKIDLTLMQQNLVIKPFSAPIQAPSYFLGCTILGDGNIVPVLDGPSLISAWKEWQNNRQVNFSIFDSVQSETDIGRSPEPTTPTILLVDDSITIRQNLSAVLQKQGYQIVQASDGLEAIEHLKLKNNIRAVISDVDMPRMGGLEFLRRSRQEFAHRSLPIIMLTSRSSESYRQLANRLGATAYLTKPYLEIELLNTLEHCLASISK
jgi:two-component system, chemotaxis family, sensor histidine kinase and response regulator PixL